MGLRALRERLTPPNAWIKGAFARSAKGNEVSIHNPKATCWCLMGAISLEDISSKEYYALCKEISKKNGSATTIKIFNDTPNITHEDILEVLDHAIKEVEA
jgi:hypothetical protein